jgi:putative FmdB family regulatory protein
MKIADGGCRLMPIYEYECSKCGEIEEIFQKFSDKPLVKCKRCSGKLHKLISHSSFHLKGTGWYVTDYANKSRSNGTPPKKAVDAKSSDPPKTATNEKATKTDPDNSA